MRYFISVFLLVGCTTVSQPEQFETNQGEPLTCLRYEQKECGMTLLQCGYERSIEFECMTGVRYIGPILQGDAK